MKQVRLDQQGQERRDVSVVCGPGRSHSGPLALRYVCAFLRFQFFGWGPRRPTLVRRAAREASFRPKGLDDLVGPDFALETVQWLGAKELL